MRNHKWALGTWAWKTPHTWVPHFQEYITLNNPPTHHCHLVAGETPSFLDRQESTITHLQWGYEVGWFAEVQGLGRSALSTACCPEGSSKEAAWRNVAEFPWSLEQSSVLQGACCSAPLTLPSRMMSLRSRERPQKESRGESGRSHLGQEGEARGQGHLKQLRTPAGPHLSPVFLSSCLFLLPATIDMH